MAVHVAPPAGADPRRPDARTTLHRSRVRVQVRGSTDSYDDVRGRDESLQRGTQRQQTPSGRKRIQVGQANFTSSCLINT